VKSPWYILPVIVVAQFFCTSLWFAGNAVLGDLMALYGLADNSVGHLTAAVQLGFITGTLLYAILTIADRFSPSKVFFLSAIFGASANVLIIVLPSEFYGLLVLRFVTGFFLAGIYPVGMKIASDHFAQGLGKALGYLVGALVLGTALPHLIRGYSLDLNWKWVMIITSVLCLTGGALVYLLVGDGPHHKKGKQVDFSAFFRVFKDKTFRSPAFGYFGHMWELYTFWAFVPVMIQLYNEKVGTTLNISLWSFGIIGVGFLSCIVGGYLSLSIGSRKTAFFSLLGSGICCLISLWMLDFHPNVFLVFLFIWGILVIADSPQFSTLVARYAPAENKGTALTIVNCIGFSITIFSIELVTYLSEAFTLDKVLIILVIGPLLGLIGLGFRDNVITA
jgi:MFS family permease